MLQLMRLFSLLIGLGIAAMLSGLALAWRQVGAQATRTKIRIGALVPLLGLLANLLMLCAAVTLLCADAVRSIA